MWRRCGWPSEQIDREGENRQALELRFLPDHSHRLVAVHFRHHDVHQHDRDVGGRFENADRLLASVGGDDLHAVAFEHAGESEDVAHVVVDDEDLLALQGLVGLVEPFEHPLLLRGEIGDDAVEEERGLVE
jgi:hypothetical protein